MSETVSLKEAQAEIQSKIASMKEELKTLGEKLFREGSQDIFDAYPNLVSFGWVQYTPFFNDGDECVFGVHADYSMSFAFNNKPDVSDGTYLDDDDEDKTDYRYVELSYRVLRGEAEPQGDEAAMLAAHGLVTSVDNDTLKSLFGDHARVTVTREGIDTDYYEHD
jgi:hypothetical protein